jgi:hypothetical protein
MRIHSMRYLLERIEFRKVVVLTSQLDSIDVLDVSFAPFGLQCASE